MKEFSKDYFLEINEEKKIYFRFSKNNLLKMTTPRISIFFLLMKEYPRIPT